LGKVNALPIENITNSKDLTNDVYDLQLSSELVDMAGAVKVLTIGDRSAALDFAVGSTISEDALGLPRKETPDAGAYEGEKKAFDPVNTVFNTTTSTQYYTIQEAVNDASSGDVITFNGLHKEQITIAKSLTLQGDNATEDILEGLKDQDINGGSVVTIPSGDIEVTFNHFTITGGETLTEGVDGGGVKITDVTGLVSFSNMIIKSNHSAGRGGGISSIGGNLTINNSVIEDNSTTVSKEFYGGGISIAPSKTILEATVAVIKNSTISNNTTAKAGGGIGIDGRYRNGNPLEVTIENVTVFGNTSTTNAGAGLFVRTDDLASNSTEASVKVTVDHSTIAYNVGKGINFAKAGDQLVDFTLSNSIVSESGTSSQADIEFNNANATVTNTFMGKIAGTPVVNNNSKDIDSNTYFLELSDELEGDGLVKVLTISELSSAVDFAEGSTSTADALGLPRQGTPDAGAFEGGEITFDDENTVVLNDKQYRSVVEAMNYVSKNDTIHIRGVHTVSLILTQGITFLGEDPTKDILQASDVYGESTERLIYFGNSADTVNIEHLGLRHGHSTEDTGGAIKTETVSGLLSLKDVHIYKNTSDKNGGAISAGGANLKLENVDVYDNSSSGNGGGLFIFSKNSSTQDMKVEINNSVISRNSAAGHSGGITVDGNAQYGLNNRVLVEINNTIIAENAANESGAMQIKGSLHLDGESSNITVKFNHNTIAYNTSNGNKYGVSFVGTELGMPYFYCYNSLIGQNGTFDNNDINFANSNSKEVFNNVFGKVYQLTKWTESESDNHINQDIDGTQIGKETAEDGTSMYPISGGSLAIDHALSSNSLSTDHTGYARKYTADAGAYEYRSLVWLGVNSSDGNIATNWNEQRVPGEDEYVYISKHANNQLSVSTSNVTLGNVEIQEGAEVMISDDYSLIVNSDLQHKGTITMASGGSLIVNGTMEQSEAAVVSQETVNLRLVGPMVSEGLPEEDITFNSFDPTLVAENGLRSAFITEKSSVLQSGEGYLATEASTFTFSGVAISEDLKMERSVSETSYHTFSNPFNAYIDYNDLMFANENSLGAVYLWEVNAEGEDELLTVTQLGAVGNHLKTWDGSIAAGEGFFAQLHDNDLTFSKEMRIESIRAYRATESVESEIPLVKINLKSSGTNAQNETLVGFADTATQGFDQGFDAYKHDGNNGVRLYSKMNEEAEMAINYLPFNDGEVTIPLFIDVNEKEEYSLTFSDLKALGDYYVVLEDKEFNTFTELSEDDVYSFISDEVSNSNRFNLIISKSKVITSVDDVTSSIQLQVTPNAVTVKSDYITQNGGEILIYNELGSVLLQEELDRGNASSTVAYQFSKQRIYIIHIKTSNGIKTHKVMF
ncbi:choice-of-anchor Q domain-containing protein, partial [Flammeovirga agarivorans]